jgi:uncharacterized protein YdeI (YjbR/CyaY-like superfamily)
MQKQEPETFYPETRKQWRQWLQKNHAKKQSIWLIYYRKSTNTATITWSDAVEEALCFGWIDSTARPIDGEKFMQYFTRRKPTSVWSKINKQKVQNLTDAGLMTAAGLKCIETAKENGSWTILDDVEELKIPADLERKLKTKRGSKAFFLSLSKSMQKSLLHRLVLAKRPETREKRIDEIATMMGNKQKPA